MPSPIPGRHAGKIAVVTGAGQGIGRGVALRLAAEGAHVVVAEYNGDSAEAVAVECAHLGPEAMGYQIDISDTTQVDRMVQAVVARFGRIDILVNNAGVLVKAPMLELSEADYDRTHRVNQRGLLFCLQRVARQMVAQVPVSVKAAGRARESHGKIVNFSSVAGRSGRPTSVDYSATKWAAISITQSAALALAPYNINVNAVCPGTVPTPMWDYIDSTEGERAGLESGEWLRRHVETIPLKRAATTEDIAAVVSFLCSNDADYVTGQAINVDGGEEMN